MGFLLDTNICSAALKQSQIAMVHSRLIQFGGQLFVSRLSCAELYALGYTASAKRLGEIDDLLNEFKILEFDDNCSREYGRLHAQLAGYGVAVSVVDLMIAATAIEHDLILVTHDKDFEPIARAVSGLRTIDWLA